MFVACGGVFLPPFFPIAGIWLACVVRGVCPSCVSLVAVFFFLTVDHNRRTTKEDGRACVLLFSAVCTCSNLPPIFLREGSLQSMFCSLDSLLAGGLTRLV